MAKASIARLVLVAMCSAGICAPSAVAAAPRNNDYLRSIQINDLAPLLPEWTDLDRSTEEATTQTDLLHVDRNGDPLGGGPPEPTQCRQASFGKTVWYDFKPHVAGGVRLDVSGFNLAVVVYEYEMANPGDLEQIACQDAAGGSRVRMQLESTEIRKGHRYTVQVGGVGSGVDAASGPLDFRFNFIPDRDEDSVFDVSDSCPNRPGLGSPENGCPPTLKPRWDHDWEPASSGIRLTSFEVIRVPSGGEVRARCRRCNSLSQRITVAAGARRVRLSRFIGPTLPAGATLQVWVTRRKTPKGVYRFGAIGKYWRFTVSSGGLTVGADRCLEPGSTTPKRTCR